MEKCRERPACAIQFSDRDAGCGTNIRLHLTDNNLRIRVNGSSLALRVTHTAAPPAGEIFGDVLSAVRSVSRYVSCHREPPSMTNPYRRPGFPATHRRRKPNLHSEFRHCPSASVIVARQEYSMVRFHLSPCFPIVEEAVEKRAHHRCSSATQVGSIECKSARRIFLCSCTEKGVDHFVRAY